MTTVADLLLLINDADRLLGTFEGEFADWGRPFVSDAARVVVGRDVTDGRLRIRATERDLFPHDEVARRRIWFETPHRLRVELLRADQVVGLGVRDGRRWWRWDCAAGSTSGVQAMGQSGSVPPLLNPPLLSPAQLVGLLRIEAAGAGSRLGRNVILAHARSRDHELAHRLTYELELDAEYGTILRRAVFDRGTCVQVSEATGVRFGKKISPECFVFQPPDRPVLV